MATTTAPGTCAAKNFLPLKVRRPLEKSCVAISSRLRPCARRSRASLTAGWSLVYRGADLLTGGYRLFRCAWVFPLRAYCSPDALIRTPKRIATSAAIRSASTNSDVRMEATISSDNFTRAPIVGSRRCFSPRESPASRSAVAHTTRSSTPCYAHSSTFRSAPARSVSSFGCQYRPGTRRRLCAHRLTRHDSIHRARCDASTKGVREFGTRHRNCG